MSAVLFGYSVSSTNKTDRHSDMISYSNLNHILNGETYTYPCSTPVCRVLGRLILCCCCNFSLVTDSAMHLHNGARVAQ